ncbi:MAG: hypothetical protein QOF10_111, partial [Kribbellaceae bacterium]|nr:hypothetical protein [Kribbellaceae bacterium]
MSTVPGAQRITLGVEIALAYLAGAGTFVLVAVVVAGIQSDVPIVIFGILLVAAVVGLARFEGVAYAVPIAMAGMLAYDWYYVPPIVPLAIPDSANLAELLVYLAVAVVIGELAARATRQARASEAARAQIADEQAALRRVATRVAQGVPAQELLAVVAEEAGTLLDVDATRIIRYEGEEEVVDLIEWSKPGYDPASFDRARLEGRSVSADVLRTGRVARIDNYDDVEQRLAFVRGLKIKSVMGAPIVVEGRLWGVMVAWSATEALPVDAEGRLTDFTELVATAISNTEAGAEVTRLADEQAALRRVATMVAEERPAEEVFAKVAEEVGRLLHVDATAMLRYEPDRTATYMAEWSEQEIRFPVSTSVPVEGDNVTSRVFRTHRPARFNDVPGATGPTADVARAVGIRSAAGSPIVVQGRLWGLMIAMSTQPEPLPPQTESRMGEFTDLVATAISNLEAWSDLAASRARIVEATDQTRRRFERDLHDGVQQRLVSLTLELRGAEAVAPPESVDLRAQLSQVGDGLTGVLDDLRELSRGIHPAILSEGGLGPALKALARRSAVPVELDVSVQQRLAERVEVAAYYVVSEALANAAKHA